MIMRRVNHQSLKWQVPLFVNYVDFKKAFDSIHRESLWRILKLYGIPDKYINIFRALYGNTRCCVKTGTGMTEMFDILTGVRQGCILSPFLFLIIIDFIMRKTTHGQDYGIQLGPGKLADLDFADDIALLSNIRDALQDITTGLQNNALKVGLRISAEKTKAMIVGEQQAIPLTVDQKDIEYVDKFQYLGTYMSRTGDVDTDIRARIGKASGVFRRLHNV